MYHAVLCLINGTIINPLTRFYDFLIVAVSEEACPDVCGDDTSRTRANAPKVTTLCDSKYLLFFIGYLCFTISCFDEIFD